MGAISALIISPWMFLIIKRLVSWQIKKMTVYSEHITAATGWI